MEISYSSWPWHRSDATALAGYANMMMMIEPWLMALGKPAYDFLVIIELFSLALTVGTLQG